MFVQFDTDPHLAEHARPERFVTTAWSAQHRSGPSGGTRCACWWRADQDPAGQHE
ncbi:MAG: hypothetical protein ACYCU5_05655 [Actinomycetes bacterium]